MTDAPTRTTRSRHLVGVVPAAGRATRLGPISSSKELLPVIRSSSGEDSPDRRTGPVISFLLRGFEAAGIESAVIVIAPEKLDIPETLRDGEQFGLNLAYAFRRLPYGVPFTVDSVHAMVRDDIVVFGFPDILFVPDDAIDRMVRRLDDSSADVILGTFPVSETRKWDAVVVGKDGRIEDVVPKPHERLTGRTWILAVWQPSFTEFLHDYVAQFDPEKYEAAGREADIAMGVVFREAFRAGLEFESVFIADGKCLDIGTPDDLRRAREVN